jgi:hypothetical protein
MDLRCPEIGQNQDKKNSIEEGQVAEYPGRLHNGPDCALSIIDG